MLLRSSLVFFWLLSEYHSHFPSVRCLNIYLKRATLARTFKALVKAVRCALVHVYMHYHSIALHKYKFCNTLHRNKHMYTPLICILQYKYVK